MYDTVYHIVLYITLYIVLSIVLYITLYISQCIVLFTDEFSLKHFGHVIKQGRLVETTSVGETPLLMPLNDREVQLAAAYLVCYF